VAVRIQMRRGTSSEWNSADPILNEGEIGYNTTLGQIKIGDGTSQWSALTYLATESELNSSLANYIELTEKGAGDGVAELDSEKNILTRASVIFEGATTNGYQTTVTVVDPTQDNTLTIPNVSGNIITSGDTGTVTNAMLAGSIANDKLSNSAITINGTPVSLGGTITIAGDIEGVSAGTGLTGGGTSGTVTLSLDTTIAATTNNTLTLSNKSISLATNTLSGTIAEFNTALSDADFATTAGVETLSGKTISGTSNTLTNIANTSLTNSSVTVNGSSISLGGSATVTAVNPNALTISTGLSGTSYDGSAAVTIAVDSTIATTSSSQTLTNKTLGASTVLGANLGAATYKITNLGTPTDATDAATKAYVDAVTEGLHIHESCVAATTSNVDLSTGLENGDLLDGVTLATGNRVLVKNQSTTSENGIYVVQESGAAVRSSDYNTASEIDPGDFVFISGGTVNDNTGWVQVNTITTLGTDPIQFTQFSGAGTYLAGNGLTLTGNTFSINTGTTVDLNTAQTLTSKTFTLGSNTISGTIAEFNTALTDADFATLAGSETFTNKTLTGPTISGLTLSDSSIVFEGSSADEFETTLTVTNPTADRTITFPNATGTIALQGYLPSSLTWGDLKNGKSA